MAQYDQIQAKNYNDIRKSLNALLGAGTGEFGYGQALASFDVKEGMEIDKAHFDYLRLDLDRCLRHQTGLDSTLSQLPAVIVGKEIVWSTIIAYQLLADQLVTSKDQFYLPSGLGYPAQMVVVNGGSKRLASGWGNNSAGQRYGEQLYYVTWSNSNAARYFFNSGGSLKITASSEGAATNTKSVGWRNVATRLNNLPFTFSASEYRQAIAGSKTEFSVTLNDATNPYYTNYAYARFTLINAKTIQVLVQFVDNDIGSHDPATDHGDPAYWGVGVDETVTVDLLAGLEYRKAIESLTIETPTFTVGDFVIPYDQVARIYSTQGAHTLIIPPGVKSVRVIIAGGGGGGAAGYYGYQGGDENNSGTLVTRPGGGGGGGETMDQYLDVVPLETLYINVGQGGLGGIASSGSNTLPTNGQDSSVVSHSGSTLIARGGKAAAGPSGGSSGAGKSGYTGGGGGGGSGSSASGVNGGAGVAYSTPQGSIVVGGGGAGGAGVGGTGGDGGGAPTGDSSAGSGGGGGGSLTPNSYNSTGGGGGVGLVVIIA